MHHFNKRSSGEISEPEVPAAAPYRDPARPVPERVRDLLARMTLEEKVAQMLCLWQQKTGTLVDAQGRFDPALARASFVARHGLGQVGRPSDAGTSGHEPEKGRTAREQAALANAIQRFFLEETRLGIPVLFHEECLHGLAAVGATSFPQPIALASTFDPALVEALYAMAAREARARGVHQALTPVLDVARDPRWGRVEETFGEDPFLVATLGVAAVRGFQGDGTFRDGRHVLATLKHFAAHGQPEGGMNCGPVNVSERELRDVFLHPFREAVRKAGAASVMASYNEIDGIPSHANRWLLRDVLRGEWGFEGFVVSDYYAILELFDRPETHGHHVARDRKEAALLAVRAGVNIELPDPDCYPHLAELVREGLLEEAELDALVAPMLAWKFRLGLFEDPYVDPDEAERLAGCAEHRALARRAATEAIILLKNDDVLPLDPARLRTLAVIGPNAHRSLLGGYSGVPKHNVTVLDGLRARLGDRVAVHYHEGCQITVGGSWHEDTVVRPDPEENRRRIAGAVATAREADAVVLVLGGNEQTAREAWSRTHLGDRTSLDLFGQQQELAEAVLALGKPTVVLLLGGRPLSVPYLAEHAPALLECWYLGQETGHAVADVLFGDASPGGKLPISLPRSVGHLPVFYNHKPSARRGYLFDDASALFPFGFGLSYTTFALENLRLEPATIPRDGTARVRIDVTNTGDRAGAEVVQLYIRDCVSSVTRPVKELRGFERVHLAPGETRTVTFDLTPEHLAFHDLDMNYVVEPGDFEIMVGSSSRDEDLQRIMLHVT
ncbi:MAG: beta-glucosidase [Rhodothermaceae bacterium]|nr:MAG: beta-glucosidase [Rhodothermaceae bacterium]